MKPEHYIGFLKNTLSHILEMNVESPADNFDEGDGHFEILMEIDSFGRYVDGYGQHSDNHTDKIRMSSGTFFVEMKDGRRLDVRISEHKKGKKP